MKKPALPGGPKAEADQDDPGMITFDPFIWPSEPPEGVPFEASQDFVGLRFQGRCSDYNVADTFFPMWAEDNNLYSCWTDGKVAGMGCSSCGIRQSDRHYRKHPASLLKSSLLSSRTAQIQILHKRTQRQMVLKMTHFKSPLHLVLEAVS